MKDKEEVANVLTWYKAVNDIKKCKECGAELYQSTFMAEGYYDSRETLDGCDQYRWLNKKEG